MEKIKIHESSSETTATIIKLKNEKELNKLNRTYSHSV